VLGSYYCDFNGNINYSDSGYWIGYLLPTKGNEKRYSCPSLSTIATMLDDEKVRMARRTLMKITNDDFTSWTQEEIDHAEIACSKYDTVGIMVRHGIVDHKMVTREWRNSIIRCWEHAQPMITTYRKDRGSDFWNDFQWLYDRAKEIRTS
jgi:hypothetical protein